MNAPAGRPGNEAPERGRNIIREAPVPLHRRIRIALLAVGVLLTLGALTFAMMRSGPVQPQEQSAPAADRVEDRYPVSLATPQVEAPARPLLAIEEHQSLYAD